MRRRLLTVAVVVLLWTAAACADDPGPQATSSPATTSAVATEEIDAASAQRLDDAIDQVMTAMRVPGAIIGVWSPDGHYVRAFGVADEFSRALAADPQRSFSPQELLDLAFAQPPAFAPGDGFEYSNTNTVLLGMVVEQVSGEPLAAVIRERILLPLEMEQTSYPTTNVLPQPHAQGYTELTDDGTEAVATEWNPSWAGPAGAMISTLADLRIWAPALAEGALLKPETQAQRMVLTTMPGLPVGDGYGLGIFSLSGWIGHNGSLPGYQTVAVHLPERQTTLVILTNTDIEQQSSVPSTTLATAITKELTPQHIYSLDPQVQNSQTPDLPSSRATTTRPR